MEPQFGIREADGSFPTKPRSSSFAKLTGTLELGFKRSQFYPNTHHHNPFKYKRSIKLQGPNLDLSMLTPSPLLQMFSPGEPLPPCHEPLPPRYLGGDEHSNLKV